MLFYIHIVCAIAFTIIQYLIITSLWYNRRKIKRLCSLYAPEIRAQDRRPPCIFQRAYNESMCVYFPGCRNRRSRAEKGSSPQCRCWCCWYYHWSIYPLQTVSHLWTRRAYICAYVCVCCVQICISRSCRARSPSSIMREQWSNSK